MPEDNSNGISALRLIDFPGGEPGLGKLAFHCTQQVAGDYPHLHNMRSPKPFQNAEAVDRKMRRNANNLTSQTRKSEVETGKLRQTEGRVVVMLWCFHSQTGILSMDRVTQKQI